MSKTFAAVILGLTVMLSASASAAEVPADGWYRFSNTHEYKGTPSTIVQPFEIKKVDMYKGTDKHLKGCGIYVFKFGDKYLVADGSKDGAKVEVKETSKPTKFVLKKWSTGWSMANVTDTNNHVSFNYHGKGKYMLRRFNAGGRGLKDKMWTMKKMEE